MESKFFGATGRLEKCWVTGIWYNGSKMNHYTRFPAVEAEKNVTPSKFIDKVLVKSSTSLWRHDISECFDVIQQ